MSTIEDISNWVLVDYLNRASDTALQAVTRRAAVRVYKLVCAAVPFDELMVTSSELAMVASQSSYVIGTAQGAGIDWVVSPEIRSIANLRITFDASSKRRLRRSHVRSFDSLSVTAASRPFSYARWGKTLEFNPPPNSAAYTVRFRYWSRPIIDATPQNTVLLSPAEWDTLLQWETAFEVLYDLDQIDKAMTLVAPSQPAMGPSPRKMRTSEMGIIPRLWNNLLHTMSEQEGVDEDFSINPIMRSYSVIGGR